MASRGQLSFDPHSFLSKIGDGKTISRFRKDEIVFSQGEPADSVYYIQEGRAKVVVVSKQGKEAVIAILGAGDFVGEGCLAGQKRRAATLATLQDCTISCIEKAVMIRMLQLESKFSALFIEYLLARNIRVEEDLVDHLFNSSEKRLARLLLILANFGKEGRPEPIATQQISQETLAEMIGTTRARVNYFMNKFRRLGFIKYNRKIEVHSSLLSVVLKD
jgi:CRP-like cAMP-binding protein